ncbi:concanavalin A-like lectin/glucanase [Dendrothele bispora CBS 962.96]|uniref:Concanavalin A-like lectin/glucanase n=1 Tax=Dendrothele bispora (strain CBS 962.96) TaxID=1314807 RepID=A0A4S8KQN8_DENBC|nr:concanavalin A-like lectin/glucanase [Dendrothele bispora CBS 962.96]
MSDPFASPAPSIKHEEVDEQHVHFQEEEEHHYTTTTTSTSATAAAATVSSSHVHTHSHIVDVTTTLANATAFAVTNSRVPSASALNLHHGGGSYSGWSTPYSTGTPMGSSVPLPLSRPGTSGTTSGAAFNNNSGVSSAFAPHNSSQSNLSKRLTTVPVMKSTLLPELLDAPKSSSSPSLSSVKTISLPLSSKTPSKQPKVSKPWLSDRSRTHPFSRHRISRFLVYALVLLGLGIGGMQCYLTYRNVKFHRMDNAPLCLVLDEGFDDPGTVFGTDNSVGGTFWREVDMSGGGNGQFEMTTASEKNSFVQDGFLFLMPTLTEEEIGRDNVYGQNGPYIYNITGCTFNQTATTSGFIPDPKDPSREIFDYSSYYRSCSATSNQTVGSIINPVQSARVSTRLNALSELNNSSSSRPLGSLSSGKISIRARLPTGDWLWPALWLLPVNNTYGGWPASGEIDMVESRGNDIHYTAHGSNYVQGSLHWGPSSSSSSSSGYSPSSGSWFIDAVSLSYSWWSRTRGPPSSRSFAADFHEYVMEWTEEFVRIYVDTRLHTLLEYRFDDAPFWNKGKKAGIWGEPGSNNAFRDPSTGQLQGIKDPWGTVDGLGTTGDGSVASGGTGRSDGKGVLPGGRKPKWNAPFDQDFYLIMNVAVGGTNGWFPDGQGDKPWLNGAGQQTAMREFADKKDEWYQSWPQGEEMDRRAMVVDWVKMWRHC